MAFQLALLAVRPADAWTVVTVVLAVPALVLLLAPATTSSWLRQRPRTDGPTPWVVALVLGLLASPTAAGLAAADGLELLHGLFAIAAVGFAWVFARAHVGGLWAARLAYPILGVLAALSSPIAGAIALTAYVGGVTVLAWRREALRAVQPLAPPRVPVYPIPPELAPSEVLGAAGYDDAGRRNRRTDTEEQPL
jgi:hypothetical protein